MPLSAIDRTRNARIAALIKIAKTPPSRRTALTAAATKASGNSYISPGHDCVLCGSPRVDPQAPPEDQQQMADEFRRLHLIRAGIRSGEVRRKKRS